VESPVGGDLTHIGARDSIGSLGGLHLGVWSARPAPWGCPWTHRVRWVRRVARIARRGFSDAAGPLIDVVWSSCVFTIGDNLLP
jgi:hypothetical protein